MNDKSERALVFIAETIGMLGPKAPAAPEYDNVLDVLGELDRLQADNARLRDQVNAIVAWAESCDDSANNPDLDADVAHDRKESAQDIFRLLGIEAHK